MANEYLDNLVAELEQSGVMTPASQLSNTTQVNKNVNDIDLQAIMDIERITGTKFSDEQRAVLEHRGNACILACAGSGKTTTSVNLIAKRIMTGEIKDVNKMIYTTYSKAGATEMKERLDKLLAKLGINKDVQVRTLHAFFLSIIRTFGINSNIISAGERSRFIREACKEAEYLPKDDDLMLIDSLLSYQVNNLLTDKKTIESYVNTIDDLNVNTYAKIRSGYAKKKLEKGLIDYDDMQTYLWKWLTQDVKSEDPNVKAIGIAARDYCKAYFTDFYIDEAQDVSKIQFAIIRAIVTDPNDKNKLTAGLTFIGDDDQCLVEDTIIATDNGSKPIKDIKVGDKVLSVDNEKIVKSTVMDVYSHDINNNIPLVEIRTSSGKSYIATADHKVMVKIPDRFRNNAINIDENQYVISDTLQEILRVHNEELNIEKISSRLNTFGYIMELPHFGKDVRTNNGYIITSAMPLSSGMIFGRLSYNNTGTADDEIVSVKLIDKSEMIKQNKKVYCLNLANNHNYFANDLLTHNCIYTWRGSDPSIILTAGATFNMTVFKLTTNYRCYNEIVDFAANGVKHNNGRYEKDMKAHNQGGSVKITMESNKDLCALSNVAMAQIKKWIADGNNPKDIAVLSRNNFHLAILSNMLLREGIYCNITEEMKLTKSFMYNDIKDLIAMSGPTWDSNLTQRLMWKLCRFLGGGNSKMIADFQNTCALSLQDALGYIVKHYIDDTIVFDKKLGITLQAEQKIEYCIKTKLTADTRQDIKYVYLAVTNEDRQAGLKTLMFMYEQGTKFLYKSADRSRSIKGLTNYVQQVIDKDGFDGALNFFRMTEQLESGSMVIPGQKITLTTVHSAKGREWKNVIMFACDNVSFPSFDGIVSMLNDGISIHDINYSLSEERRLFYVGCTRAKENLLLITYPEPSIFILEALGITKENADTSNAKIIELAQQQDWVTIYKDEINSVILDPSSKYYFDKNTL